MAAADSSVVPLSTAATPSDGGSRNTDVTGRFARSASTSSVLRMSFADTAAMFAAIVAVTAGTSPAIVTMARLAPATLTCEAR